MSWTAEITNCGTALRAAERDAARGSNAPPCSAPAVASSATDMPALIVIRVGRLGKHVQAISVIWGKPLGGWTFEK